MITKVDFELLKNQIVLDTLRKEIHCTLDEEKKQILWEWINNYGLFLNTLAKSSTFAHLAHKELKKLTEPEKSFDKLKELWEGYKKTDCSCLEEYLVGKGRAYNSNTIHQWIAEHCGFATTAEVKQAIQQLKNQ